ncbi:MAG: hypothetical protein WEB89_12410 [Balneolales bacterium]
MKNRLFNVLIYISLIFLVIALYTADYLVIPRIYSHLNLLISFFLLFAGYLAYVACWDKILKINHIRVGFGAHLAGNGLSVFGKYIPGKVWVLLGRSAYINQHHGVELGEGTLLSFKAQLISIWTGLFIGLFGYLLASSFSFQSLAAMGIWLALSPILFNKTITRWGDKVVKKVLKKKRNFLPSIPIRY